MKRNLYLLSILLCTLLGIQTAQAQQYPDGHSTKVTIQLDLENMVANVTFKVCDMAQDGTPLERLDRFEIYKNYGEELLETIKPVNPGDVFERTYPIEMGTWAYWTCKAYVDENHAHYYEGSSVKVEFTIGYPENVTASLTQGGAPVRVSFDLPTTDSRNNPIVKGAKFTKAYLWRDNYEKGEYGVKVAELTDVMEPGQRCTLSDDTAELGAEYYYRVGCDGEVSGYTAESYTAGVNVFVGSDTPGHVQNLKGSHSTTDEGYLVNLSWEAPTSGSHGGGIDVESLLYKVYTVDPEDETNVTLVSPEEGLTATNFSFVMTDIERPDYYSFAVSAINDMSTPYNEQMEYIEMILGPSYQLPFEEGFNKANVYDYPEAEMLWSENDWGWTTTSYTYIWHPTGECTTIYDKDFKEFVNEYEYETVPVTDGTVPGFLNMNNSWLDKPTYFYSYSLDLSKAADPFVTLDAFQYNTTGNSKVEVMARAGEDTEFQSIGEVVIKNETLGWVNQRFELAEFAGKDNVQIAVCYTPGSEMVLVCIDNIRVAFDNEIKEPEFFAPENCVAATNEENRMIVLTWDAPTAPEGFSINGYNVYVDDKQHNTELVTGTHYTLMNVEDGKYKFEIEVVYSNGKTLKGESFNAIMTNTNVEYLLTNAITVEGNELVLNVDGEVTLVTADGKVIYNGNGNARVNVAGGIYLVKTATKTIKFMIK